MEAGASLRSERSPLARCWAEQPAPGRLVRMLTAAPHPALAGDVEYLWRLDLTAPLPAPAVRRCAGKGAVDVVLALDGHFAEDAEQRLFGAGTRGAYVIGPMTRWADVVSSGRCTAVGARIRPGRAAALLRTSAARLQDAVFRLDDLRAELGGVDPGSMPDPVAAAAALERSLLELRRRAGEPDPLVDATVRLVERSRGELRVRELARDVGASPRQLERRFREHVGLSPKRWSRIARLDQAVRLLSCGAAPDYGDVVAACGFYDQAHLIREFRALAGLTPGALAQGRDRCH